MAEIRDNQQNQQNNQQQSSNQQGQQQQQTTNQQGNNPDADPNWQPATTGAVIDPENDGRLKENREQGKTKGTTEHSSKAPNVDQDDSGSVNNTDNQQPQAKENREMMDARKEQDRDQQSGGNNQ